MRSIFISNNGLSDHIGVAQILPYLEGLSQAGHRIEVISVEDFRKAKVFQEIVLPRLLAANIAHFPIHRSLSPIVRSIERFSLPRRMHRILSTRVKAGDPALIHCRSYMPLSAVLKVASDFGRPFIFDMRGFWIDQRIEGGQWDGKRLFYRMLIKRFRKLERRAFEQASAIVTLTQDAANKVAREPQYAGAPISVIPCSVDTKMFRFDPAARRSVRARLNFGPDDIVLAWLGSAGSLYKIDMAYRLLDRLKDRGVCVKLLMLGDHDADSHIAEAAKLGIVLNSADFRIVKTDHSGVPDYLSAADIGISTIIATLSSLGVSATKTGEYLACGLPVISNLGIGDIERIITDGANGYVLREFSDYEIARAADLIQSSQFDSRAEIAAQAAEKFEISKAIGSYGVIYASLANIESGT